MKKLLYFSLAVLCMATTACTKDNEGVKTQIETTLPTIELTSMGLINQAGPFATTDAIQVSFGGALTKSDAGTFDFAWYDGTTNARVDSVHFKGWTEAAATANGNNSISVTYSQATYPNTWTFSGNLVLKLAKLTSGKSYTLRLYGRTSEDKMATVSVSKFITMK